MPREREPSFHDDRTIILAPTGKDGRLLAGLLERMAKPCKVAADVHEVGSLILEGAGAAIVSEEALFGDAVERLLVVLREQPPWSDFPLILLTVAGRVTAESERMRTLRMPLGNTFLLERPLRPETLVSTLEIALRGRYRQYQIRDNMRQYALAQEALLRSEKLAVTGRLAASIAHEINNPLESVTNLLYLMRGDLEPDERKQYLLAAEQELARVAEITKQTLRFYREPTQAVETGLVAVVESVLTLFHSRLQAAKIKVESEVRSASAVVWSSPGELRQVIANIVGNAIDAMRLGGRMRIRISDNRDPRLPQQRRIRLTIADTGSGIAPAVLPTIFEPFVTTKGETGTGLGLWITGEIVQKNGWSIRVSSSRRAGQAGTAFSIVIPLQSSAKEQDNSYAISERSDAPRLQSV